MDVPFQVGLQIARRMGPKCVRAVMQVITKTTTLARQMYVVANMEIQFTVVLRSA
jgi:hypothetical protein